MARSRSPVLGSIVFVCAMIGVAVPFAPARAVAPADRMSALEAIDAAVTAGEISTAEGLLDKVRLVVGSGALPKRFEPAGGEPLKCGTAILLEATERLAELPADMQLEVLGLTSRPATTAYLDTPHFRIHYDTAGPGMIYGWPDTAYRDAVAAACENAWHFYHQKNAWQTPPPDAEQGGNALIDCYVADAGGAYGYTQAESRAPGATGGSTAFFVVDHAYDPPFSYADRTLPMKVTVAHEYHHVVQMGYTTANRWWMENVATYMEDEVYPEIGDCRQFIYYYTNFPYQALSTMNGAHEYGCFIWPTMLRTKWSPDVIRQIFACTATGASIEACFDETLGRFGKDYGSTLAEWGVWNFYTQQRSDGNHYPLGAEYPYLLVSDQQIAAYPQHARHPSLARRPEPTGQSVMRLVRDTTSPDRKLTISFDGPECTGQVAMVVKEAGQQLFHEYRMELDAGGNGTLDVPGWNLADYGQLIVQMAPSCDGAQDYAFDAVTTGATDVGNPTAPAGAVRLDQNEPNPFGAVTRIRYALDTEMPIRLAVFDPSGRMVRSLVEGRQPAGEHEVAWDARDDAGTPVASGVYFYRLQTDRRAEVRKAVLTP